MKLCGRCLMPKVPVDECVCLDEDEDGGDEDSADDTPGR